MAFILFLALHLLNDCNAWTTNYSKVRKTTQLGVSNLGPRSLARRDFFQKSSATVASLMIASLGSTSSRAAGDDELIDVYFGCGTKIYCIIGVSVCN